MPKRKLDRFLVHLMSHGRELHNLGAANIKALWPEVLTYWKELILKKRIVKSTATVITRGGFE